MSKLAPKQTRLSLALTDPREYGLEVADGGLAKLLYDAYARGRGYPMHFGDQMALDEAIRYSLATREDAPLYRALSAAHDDDAYATTIAAITHSSCRRVLGNAVHVMFAVPITLHCVTWPVAAERASEDWLDFPRISEAIGLPSITGGIKDLAVLPHLFTLEALNKLPWSTWYSLTEHMPSAPAKVLTGLPTPSPFEPPTADNRAQSRIIIGGFSCSGQVAERFQRNTVLNQAENAHVLTTVLQGQLGTSQGLRVIAGTPSIALAAISEAQHMLNCARLRCFLDEVGCSLEELVTLEAETVKRADGEGSVRFKTSIRSCEWVLQKAEPWYSQRRHWKLFTSDLAAPYLKVQLGLTENHFDPRELLDDLDEMLG